MASRERFDYSVFRGNKTSQDYFSVVLRDGDSFLVGGRNLLYKLNVHDLKVFIMISWIS